MPKYRPPSLSESSRNNSQNSASSYKTVGEENHKMSNLDTDMNSGEGFNLSNEPNLATILHESDCRYNEMKQILVEMQSREIIREEAHQKEMENMRVNMRDLMLAIKGKFADTENQKMPTASANNGSLNSPPQEKENISENLKLKPIKWPEPYNHEDQSQWKTTHGVLNYIFQRDVIERKFLTSGDYFMTLFSHAVTGTAKLMITGQFQEMMLNGQSWDGLGFLKVMDDTFRDRNEEESASALFHACRQFKDESLSSYLPRFQQLLARSASSSMDDKNKIHKLRSSLNTTTKNYLIGRPQPTCFRALVDYLSTIGSQIEEVGLVKTKRYPIGKVGIFDDGTRGIAGGRLLGMSTAHTSHSQPVITENTNKDADGDIEMTGMNKIRAKWVSQKEIDRRRADGDCLRCGRKGHRISKCKFLPPMRTETSVNLTSFVGDQGDKFTEKDQESEQLKA